MVMLVILILGGTAMLLNALNSSTPQLARAKVTADALALAKEALIGYALTYGDTHTNVSGFLPCPDQGQNNTEDGEANASCGTDSGGNIQTNISAIGKLPWKTLKISPLKDGSGECFWYAVSGNYKNNPNTDLMNWDNNGLFQIMSPDGVNFIPGSSAANQPVAAIFSPGTAIGTQSRNSVTKAPSCGGNYTAANYLDNDTIHGINNAAVSATANAVTQFISGQVKDLSGNEIVNDRLLIITRDDIFSAIKKRSDFVSFISTMINSARSCLNTSFPVPVTLDFSSTQLIEASGGVIVGSLEIGRVPKSCLTTPYNNWQDNLLYAMCSSGTTCLKLNSAIPNCKGIVIFTGERNLSQSRISNIQKNTWSNYLEDTPNANLTTFSTGGTVFTGATAYSATSPSTDIMACIPL